MSYSWLTIRQSTLYKHVNDIANGLASNVQNRATYVDLAKQFRMPYWDWSVNSPIFPQAALNNVPPPSTPQFQITGFKSPTYNPLYQYPFPSSAPSAIKGVSVYPP